MTDTLLKVGMSAPTEKRDPTFRERFVVPLVIIFVTAPLVGFPFECNIIQERTSRVYSTSKLDNPSPASQYSARKRL